MFAFLSKVDSDAFSHSFSPAMNSLRRKRTVLVFFIDLCFHNIIFFLKSQIIFFLDCVSWFGETIEKNKLFIKYHKINMSYICSYFRYFFSTFLGVATLIISFPYLFFKSKITFSNSLFSFFSEGFSNKET